MPCGLIIDSSISTSNFLFGFEIEKTMKSRLKLHFLLSTLYFFLMTSTALATPLFNYFKDREVDFFPVPIVESRPDRGNSYGLMPLILLTDQEKAMKAIFGVIGQYNSVTKFDGAVLAHFYPEADREFIFFAGASSRFAREFSFRFFDPHLTKKIYLECDVLFLKTPFGHFFGLGPLSNKNDQSNYTSRNFYFEPTFGYYLLKHLRTQFGFKYRTTDLLSRAMTQYPDTLGRYGSLPNVIDSSNMIYEVSVIFDNRHAGQISKKGSLAGITYLFSNRVMGSDFSFQGLRFDVVHLFSLLNDSLTTAFRFHVQKIFGRATPFYEMSGLGGPFELRAFTPNRFVDKGKVIFQLEERYKLLDWKLLGIPFEIHTDPFIEVGRVFDAFSHLGFNFWQPVGGLGIRLFVPPNVLGRIDLAFGADGFEVYTVLGYPF